MASASEPEIIARLEVLEAWKNSNKLPTSDGANETHLAKTVLDMEIDVNTPSISPLYKQAMATQSLKKK